MKKDFASIFGPYPSLPLLGPSPYWKCLIIAFTLNNLVQWDTMHGKLLYRHLTMVSRCERTSRNFQQGPVDLLRILCEQCTIYLSVSKLSHSSPSPPWTVELYYRALSLLLFHLLSLLSVWKQREHDRIAGIKYPTSRTSKYQSKSYKMTFFRTSRLFCY